MKKVITLMTIITFVMSFMAIAPITNAAEFYMGNDPIDRVEVDTYENFVIIDTNMPATGYGVIEKIDYYAKNTNPFSFVLVDKTSQVKWISETFTPSIGSSAYTPTEYVFVDEGWNLGLYFEEQGTIPFTYVGSPAYYEPDNSNKPNVGDVLAPYAGSSNRQYSFKATINTDLDQDDDGVLGDKDICQDTEADSLLGDLGVNRFRLTDTESGDFETWTKTDRKGVKNFALSQYDLEYTYGCSCTQILNRMASATGKDFGGHLKYGCS